MSHTSMWLSASAINIELSPEGCHITLVNNTDNRSKSINVNFITNKMCQSHANVAVAHIYPTKTLCLCVVQCFDAVGWAAGRASGLQKLSGGVLAWLSVCSKVQPCMWPSWCHCYSLSLASVKSRLVLPFCDRLTRVVLKKGPLNGFVCVCVCVVLRACACMITGSTVEERSMNREKHPLTLNRSLWRVFQGVNCISSDHPTYKF